MWLAFGRSAASQQPPTKYEVLTNPKGAPVNAVSYEDALTLGCMYERLCPVSAERAAQPALATRWTSQPSGAASPPPWSASPTPTPWRTLIGTR
eukprot:746402-Prorocentrum_minimum.AAC.3